MQKNKNKMTKSQKSVEAEKVDKEETTDNEEESIDDEAESAEEQEEDDGESAEDINLDDSSDMSSTDGEEDLDEEEEGETVGDPVELFKDKIRNTIQERYAKLKGKRLYLRLAEKLPADDDELLKKAQALSPLIRAVTRPRQKSARFCHLTMDSEEDCQHVFKDITNIIKTSTDTQLRKMHVEFVRTESAEYLEHIAQCKIKALEAKKANRKLKKAKLIADKAIKYTSTLIITNLPQRTSMLEVRTAYPKAIDVRIKRRKAAVTFPTTFDARTAYKKPTSIAGVTLKVRFDKPRKRKPRMEKEQQKESVKKVNTRKRNMPAKTTEEEEEKEHEAETVTAKKNEENKNTN